METTTCRSRNRHDQSGSRFCAFFLSVIAFSLLILSIISRVGRKTHDNRNHGNSMISFNDDDDTLIILERFLLVTVT